MSTIRRDLLHENSKAAVITMFVLAVALFGASLFAASPKELPDVAFGWGFGLVIFRAAAAFAVIVTLATVLIRGWGGLWPRSISTTGLDYEGLREGSMDLARAEARIRVLTEELQAAKTAEVSENGQ